MEFSHQDLANQVIATLNTLNENINSLGESLMSTGFGEEMMEKASLDIGQAEDDLKESRDLADVQYQDQESTDNWKANEATETLQVLVREN